MGTNVNGDGTVPHVTSFAPVAISSSTNATPIVITTGTNHGYATGDTVLVEGHVTNTNANALWVVTVLTSASFSLNNSVGNGVGGATGYCIDYAVNPLWTVPSGGDLRNAGSVSSPLTAAANVAPFLYLRTGKYRLFDVYTFGSGANSTSNAAWSTTTPGANTWTSCTSMTALLSFSPSPVCDATSVLDVSLSFAGNIGGTPGTFAAFAIGMSDNGGAYTVLPTSARAASQISTLGTAITLHTTTSVSANHTFNFSLMCRADNGTTNFALFTSWDIICHHLRTNG